jgi:hypothetical protein
LSGFFDMFILALLLLAGATQLFFTWHNYLSFADRSSRNYFGSSFSNKFPLALRGEREGFFRTGRLRLGGVTVRHVQPRSKKRINRIGSGTPKSHNNTRPSSLLGFIIVFKASRYLTLALPAQTRRQRGEVSYFCRLCRSVPSSHTCMVGFLPLSLNSTS